MTHHVPSVPLLHAVRGAALGAGILLAGLPAASAQDKIHSHAIAGAGETESLALLGDVNGDGFPDFAASAIGLGSAAVVISGFEGKRLFDIPDLGNNLTTGTPLGNAGDIDGDGRQDLVVGFVLSRETAVGLFSGATGQLLRSIPLPPELVNQPGTFGFAVAGAGDLDADGTPDVIVGAPVADLVFGSQHFTGSGRIYAFSGATGAKLFAVDSPKPSIAFGSAVAAFGDVNVDGVPDFLVGADRNAFVVSGAGGTILKSLSTPTNDDFGHAVAGLGDVDGDGRPDFVVGAPETFSEGDGSISVFSGATGALLWQKHGVVAGAALGATLARMPDSNGDGIDDVVAGAPNSFFPANDLGFVRGYSGVDGSTLFTITAQPGDGNFGNAVLGLHDANGDAVPDVVLARKDASIEGRVDIVSTRDLVLVTDVDEVSLATGGTQTFALDAGPAAAGKPYVILGSVSGVQPGLVFKGHPLPLNLDAYFLFTVQHAASGPITAALGTLDAQGRAAPALHVPHLAAPALVGLVLEHAAIVFEGPGFGAVRLTSTATTVRLTN